MNNDFAMTFWFHNIYSCDETICLFSFAYFHLISSDDSDRTSLFYHWCV